ncbi:LLM class flavin-dependent oxidoreductase [Metasolibacillus meyeri]|uniref:LLM class flavin-dependent oxidoreductase n=1 Tax=Metasolibacillus meyeri TaxID=1071052 RepID=UPI001EE69741|nr:LLM class flavin-dependent oxidoreductase [Metasolibacillus meyeri]
MIRLLKNIPISVLDLVPVVEGQSTTEAFERSRRLAILADDLGYERYWVAEHHNSRAIASSATAVVIGYLANATKKIRVGSGGIMLPNHAPLIVAEQFGTLDAMFPERIDLGLGRAPGTDPFTARALRRREAEGFEDNIEELERYLMRGKEADPIKAYPGLGANIPLWLLGSSLFSAELAARRGMPYAFASHFAPDYLMQAIGIYHTQFRPSEALEKPKMLACVNVIIAETDEEAQKLATTHYQFFLSIIRRTHDLLKPPVDDMDAIWTPFEKQAVMQQRQYMFVGSQQTVKEQLEKFVADTQVDELMVTASIYDEDARAKSFTLLKALFE